MQVNNLMNPNVVTIRPDESTYEAARMLKRHDIGSLPVVGDDGRLRGIVTDRDIVLRCVAGESVPGETHVRDIMTRQVVSIPPDADVRQAANMMAAEQVRRLPVVHNNRLVGMLALSDLARAHSCDVEASVALSEISMPATSRQ